jgi:hypothetical protein
LAIRNPSRDRRDQVWISTAASSVATAPKLAVTPGTRQQPRTAVAENCWTSTARVVDRIRAMNWQRVIVSGFDGLLGESLEEQ